MRVEVSTGWTSPAAPRQMDAAAIAESADVRQWLAVLDERGPDGRLGLHGRAVTQFVAGEPVDVVEESGDWARVVAPWQPSPLDLRGYPAWVPQSHLVPWSSTVPAPSAPASRSSPDRLEIAFDARRHLELPYLWGGTTPYGLDCSGLVHLSYRRAGTVVPRDAEAQRDAALPVPLGEEVPGDLYFFARTDGEVFHVGFVTGPHTTLHASGTAGRVVESKLSPQLLAIVSSAGRLLSWSDLPLSWVPPPVPGDRRRRGGSPPR